MSAEERTVRNVVYSDVNDCLVFITEDRARELAAIHEALSSSSTWREVRARMPAAAYEELVEVSGVEELLDFDEFLRDRRQSEPALTCDQARQEFLALPSDERRPEPDDPFDAGNIGAICDGDWPGWTQQEMLAWVPDDIQERFGTIASSRLNGDFLEFSARQEGALIAEFARHGYRCVRDDDLVRRAHGHTS
jgi:hypothetical protein